MKTTDHGDAEQQTTNRVMMVRPIRFESNVQTAATNAFQTEQGNLDAESIQNFALAEFNAYVETLRHAGVIVHVFEDTPEPHTPDSMFPNNWISFHSNGTIVLYPMLTPNRREEVRPDLISKLQSESDLSWPKTEDLTGLHEQGAILEGTGSVVLDRKHRIAYACRSPRTTDAGLEEFARRMRYELVVFDSVGFDGTPVFHTNVMMGIGTDFALVCAESIHDEVERGAVQTRLAETGHAVIPISLEQMQRFAGNFLALRSSDGVSLAVFSSGAHKSLNSAQRTEIERFARIVHTPMNTIESHGGGGVRCLLAEVFG